MWRPSGSCCRQPGLSNRASSLAFLTGQKRGCEFYRKKGIGPRLIHKYSFPRPNHDSMLDHLGDSRRSVRAPLKLTITAEGDASKPVAGETIIVNVHGALIRTSMPLADPLLTFKWHLDSESNPNTSKGFPECSDDPYCSRTIFSIHQMFPSPIPSAQVAMFLSRKLSSWAAGELEDLR
jgi:hypothetical protein